MSQNQQAINTTELRDKALAALGNGQTIAMQILDMAINQVVVSQETNKQLQEQIKNLQTKNKELEEKNSTLEARLNPKSQ